MNEIEFEKVYDLQSKSDNFYVDFTEENIFIAGSYIKSFEIDGIKANPTTKPAIFIMKLDSKGNLLKINTFQSSEEIQINDFKISQNRIFITGTFEKELNTLQSNGRKDAFVSVLNTDAFSPVPRSVPSSVP